MQKKLYAKNQSSKIAILFLSLTFVTNAWADGVSNKSVVEQIVDAQTTLANGPYKGLRVNHNKGIVVTGSFTPSASAKSITKAAHLQSTPSRVTVRFSNAGGVPTIEDTNPNANPRGIAIRFELPDGSITDIVSLSINAFPVSTPEAFLAFLHARIATKADSPKPTPLDNIVAATPSLQKFIAIPKPFPVSFATHNYFGINAFEFTNSQGEKNYVRYQIVPINGQELLSAEDVAKQSKNYLFEELPQRLKKGEAKFRLLAQVAADNDIVNDPSVVWPNDRKLVELGIISLEATVAHNAAAEKTLAFNPLILLDGIAPSDDPVLLARPGAYAISVGRKLMP